MSKIEFSDRYSATGTPYPDENSCDECEAMGVVPCQVTELNQYACESPDGRVLIIGQTEKDGSPMPDDGWVFLQCPICKGTRTKVTDLQLDDSDTNTDPANAQSDTNLVSEGE